MQTRYIQIDDRLITYNIMESNRIEHNIISSHIKSHVTKTPALFEAFTIVDLATNYDFSNASDLDAMPCFALRAIDEVYQAPVMP